MGPQAIWKGLKDKPKVFFPTSSFNNSFITSDNLFAMVFTVFQWEFSYTIYLSFPYCMSSLCFESVLLYRKVTQYFICCKHFMFQFNVGLFHAGGQQPSQGWSPAQVVRTSTETNQLAITLQHTLTSITLPTLPVRGKVYSTCKEHIFRTGIYYI